jgi:hypothetical protein
MAAKRQTSDPAPGGRRRSAAGYLVAALLVAAPVAGTVVVLTSGEGASGGSAGGPFGPHYDGLDERRGRAGVPTMAEGGGAHFHAALEVYARGERIALPPNIGIDPARPPQEMAGLHTHDDSGTIHNEAGENSTLGQFFAVWGVAFSRDELGPFRARPGEEKVRLWVDDRPSRSYAELPLADGQRIVVALGE